MSMKKPSSKLVDEFGNKIEDELKSGQFSIYSSGNEIPFIKDTVDLLDKKYAYDGNQALYVKCKKAHSSPMVTYNGLSSNYGKNYVELGDLLFVFNFYIGGSIAYRQSFITQTKCHKNKEPGRLYWEVDNSQFELLDERPTFNLINNEASASHDLSDANESFFSYSFASDVHRPFFYKTEDMKDLIDRTYSTPRFYHGFNSPYGFRYLYAVLKNGIRKRYGSTFTSGDSKFMLLKEIYQHAKMDRSNSSNSIQKLPDGGQEQSLFAIINVDIDIDGEVVGAGLPGDREELPEDFDTDLGETIRNGFEDVNSEGLNFDNI